MDEKKNMPGVPDTGRADEADGIIYRIDKGKIKMQFSVTPVYNTDSGKTIHDLILALMKKDGGNL